MKDKHEEYASRDQFLNECKAWYWSTKKATKRADKVKSLPEWAKKQLMNDFAMCERLMPLTANYADSASTLYSPGRVADYIAYLEQHGFMVIMPNA